MYFYISDYSARPDKVLGEVSYHWLLNRGRFSAHFCQRHDYLLRQMVKKTHWD